jgi:hypothetical protein
MKYIIKLEDVGYKINKNCEDVFSEALFELYKDIKKIKY